MYIKELALTNFRNYEELNISLDQGINIFKGDNAQGKTNLLEAIYVCCTTKSQRSSKDAEMISFNEDNAHINVLLEKNNISHKIDLHLQTGKRKVVSFDGLVINKVTDIYGSVNIISF